MISSKVVRRSVGKRVIATMAGRDRIIGVGRTQVKQQIVCSFSSSTAFVDYLPDSMKESMNDTIKSNVLEEMSRRDSKLWNDSSTNDKKRSDSPSLQKVNGADDGDINDPCDHLNLLMDPLDEWYLDSIPSRQISDDLPPDVQQQDPFQLSKQDMDTLSQTIRDDLVASQHPVLTKAASYFFEPGHDGGKKVRPMMIMLLSRALSTCASNETPSASSTQQQQDLLRSQRRLAEISEMIHTASLFHDDVIDDADTRRGSPAVHKVFGNKMAILAGDYLLARSSVYLARLRNIEVYETMSTIIEHLVRGEVMQVHSTNKNRTYDNDESNPHYESPLVYYLRKNFYKTASLMAQSCKSVAILGNYNDNLVMASYQYGKHLGIAFQLVDDVLDFDGKASTMGKPALTDLNAGLATAPVLFASETYTDELQPLIERKFAEDGDVDLALSYVRKSDGIQRTKDLAWTHADLAIQAIQKLPQSRYRDSLICLAHKVVERSH